MKNCLACGLANTDAASRCQACDTRVFVSSSPEAIGGHIISPEEKKFWDRMDFGQFFIITIRAATVWLFFEAVILATYLPSDLQISGGVILPARGLEQKAYMVLLRIALYLSAGLVCFRFAAQIANFFSRRPLARGFSSSGSDKEQNNT